MKFKKYFKEYLYGICVLFIFLSLILGGIAFAGYERQKTNTEYTGEFDSPQKFALDKAFNDNIELKTSAHTPIIAQNIASVLTKDNSNQGSSEGETTSVDSQNSEKSETSKEAESEHSKEDESEASKEVDTAPSDKSSDTNTASNTTETSGASDTTNSTTPPVTSSDSYANPGNDGAENFYNGSGFCQVDSSYFSDAVFIGNSRLQGFILYSKIPDLCSYTYVGMSVTTYFTKQVFPMGGVNVSASEALAATPGFQKVYLKFGINELGWVSTNQFIGEYRKILDHIYSLNPNAIVYVQSVLPFAEAAMASDPTLDKYKVIEYNQALKEMAKEYHACYLDVGSVYIGNDGYMPYEYSFDGVHINVQSIQLWRDYVLNHAVQ